MPWDSKKDRWVNPACVGEEVTLYQHVVIRRNSIEEADHQFVVELGSDEPHHSTYFENYDDALLYVIRYIAGSMMREGKKVNRP